MMFERISVQVNGFRPSCSLVFPSRLGDESLISCFNIIFDFVLFRFKFILDLFYFNCIFIFQERIFDRFSLGAKERGL